MMQARSRIHYAVLVTYARAVEALVSARPVLARIEIVLMLLVVRLSLPGVHRVRALC